MCGFYDMIRERRYAARAAWNVGRSPLKTAIALLSGDRKNPAACGVQLYFDCICQGDHSRSLDLDLLRGLLSLGLFGQFHGEHALLEARGGTKSA